MKSHSFKTFVFIWIGQLVSVVGTGLTHFGLGVWVLKETGSVSQYSLIMMFASVPGIIAAPFAGVIVDKWKRKWVMVISDTIAGLSTFSIFLLFLTNQLEVWHIYIAASVASFFSAFQFPAYQATIAMLVEKKDLGRANGMVQVAEALSVVVAPLVAGFLIVSIGIKGILLIDFISFLFAVTSLILIKFPELSRVHQEKQDKTTFFEDVLYGWKYIFKRAGLIGFLSYFAIANLLLGFFNVLLQPLLLSFTNEKMLGMVLSITGIGMFLGGAIMSITGGPKKKTASVLGTGAIGGIFLIVAGLRESVVLITIATFMIFLMMPIGNAASQAIWQSKVPLDVQGRVFALRRMIAVSLSPIAYISAGPLVEKVFNPMMILGGSGASLLGDMIGTGSGRGIGLFFILLGLLWTFASVFIYLNPRVRNLESELPDAIDLNEMVEEKESNGGKPASVEV